MHLDPGVRVGLGDLDEAAERVPASAREAVHEARGQAGAAQQQHHRAGEVLAVALGALEQEGLDG